MMDGKSRVVLVDGQEATKPLEDFAMQTDVDSSIAGFATKGEVDIEATGPASAGATGTKGQLVVTDSYIYVCVDTDTWKRAAIATWE